MAREGILVPMAPLGLTACASTAERPWSCQARPST
jgi:hypothetical protein